MRGAEASCQQGDGVSFDPGIYIAEQDGGTTMRRSEEEGMCR